LVIYYTVIDPTSKGQLDVSGFLLIFVSTKNFILVSGGWVGLGWARQAFRNRLGFYDMLRLCGSRLGGRQRGQGTCLAIADRLGLLGGFGMDG